MSSKNINTLDTYLNILHDYFYGEKDSGCYKNKQIVKNEINIENIKMPADYDSSDVLSAKFNYIGNWNNKWYFERLSTSSYTSCISIGVYDKKNTNFNDTTRGELIDRKSVV